MKWRFVCPSNGPKLNTTSLPLFCIIIQVLVHSCAWATAATPVTLMFITGIQETTLSFVDELTQSFCVCVLGAFFCSAWGKIEFVFCSHESSCCGSLNLPYIFFFSKFDLHFMNTVTGKVHCLINEQCMPQKYLQKSPFKAGGSRKTTRSRGRTWNKRAPAGHKPETLQFMICTLDPQPPKTHKLNVFYQL